MQTQFGLDFDIEEELLLEEVTSRHLDGPCGMDEDREAELVRTFLAGFRPIRLVRPVQVVPFLG